MWHAELLLEQLYKGVGDPEIQVEGCKFLKMVPAGGTKFLGYSMQFQYPVYVGFNTPQFHKNQDVPQRTVVLLLNTKDRQSLEHIMDITGHEGALGSDYIDNFKSGFGELNSLVWKIPGDLRGIQSALNCLTYNRAQPVGMYPNWVDEDVLNVTTESLRYPFDTSSESVRFATNSNNFSMCKWRFDFADQRGVHVLTDGTTTFPAINSLFWVKAYWSTKKEELRNYKNVIKTLAKTCGIIAYSIRGQQHLLVFVSEIKQDSEEPLTVERFVEKLKDEVFYKKLKKCLGISAFDEWALSYKSFDIAAFEQGKWNMSSDASAKAEPSSSTALQYRVYATFVHSPSKYLQMQSGKLADADNASIFTIKDGYLMHGDNFVHFNNKKLRSATKDERSFMRVGYSFIVSGDLDISLDVWDLHDPELVLYKHKSNNNQHFSLEPVDSIVFTTFNALLIGFEDGYVQQEWEEWSMRRRNIVSSLWSRDSDIILWNEVTPYMMNQIKSQKLFSDYVIGTKGKASGQPMQCAMSWKNVKKINKIWEPLPQGHRCLFVKFQHNNRSLLFVSAHLKAGEEDDSEDIRLIQMQHIVNEVNKTADVDACVIAGDFNSDPNLGYVDKVHSYLTKQGFANLSGFNVTYHGWGPCQFDYIYAQGCTASDLKVDNMSNQAPNKTQGSDHTPVTLTLHF